MERFKVFISSVQKEFAEERRMLVDWLRNDPLMGLFFMPFIFEDVSANNRSADRVYLDELDSSEIYLGLFGNEYGYAGTDGISPTEKEYCFASERGKTRLIFVSGNDDSGRMPQMLALIRRASSELTRRRFSGAEELRSQVYAALVAFLGERGLLRQGPFDSSPCERATLADLDEGKIRSFVRDARDRRGFPLSESAPIEEILTHLNLIVDGSPTNAAILLFAKDPQRFLVSSGIKCSQFHGTEIEKPIPSYQMYQGSVFDLVDQAVNFVLARVNLEVGTRSESTAVPVAYEIPREAVAEAIVNAVAHRDYTSTASVQVMLFSDRLEIWNPGRLPSALTPEKLRVPHGSFPANPLLATPLYLARYIEQMGTGTRDMIRKCREAGLSEPVFSVTDGFSVIIPRKLKSTGDVAGDVTGDVTGDVAGDVAGDVLPEIIMLLDVIHGDMHRDEMMDALGLKGEDNFRKRYLMPAVDSGYLEMTIPEKPKSTNQRYRLTNKGLSLIKSRKGK